MRVEVFTGREPTGAESCSENELCVDHPSVLANRCWKSELSEAGDDEFRAPKPMLDELTSPVTLSSLAELKARWHVAIRSLMRRAKEIDRLTERQYRYLNVQAMRMWGGPKNEPVFIPLERPRALRKMAEVLYGIPVNFRRMSSESNLPVFWLKRIVEAHEGDNSGEARQPGAQVAQFKTRSD